MTWPTENVNTTNADAGTDSPATFRTDMLDLLTKFNLLRSHVSTLGQTLLSRTTAVLMRGDIGAAASGANTDITSLSSPALGAATATTQATADNSTKVATTALVTAKVAAATTAFASSAENIAGTISDKAVDPLGIREAFNASGSAPVYACRAWVNFTGTGTVGILASGNVSSVTDNGVGLYTVNFSNALPDANYAIAGFAQNSGGGVAFTVGQTVYLTTKTTSACGLVCSWVNGGTPTNADATQINASFFR